MKRIIITAIVCLSAISLNAQKYFTKNATISFVSKAPMETIEGTNKTTTAVIDATSGAIAFSVIIKGFVFDQQLLQQHFNENYMESDKFPKAEFKGTITNNASVKYTTDGSYNASVSGKLTIHGVTKEVTSAGKITVAGGKISAVSEFSIALEDYNISIPAVVKNKISKNVTISVNTGMMDKLK